MPDWLPAVIVGVGLIGLAAGLAWFQWRGWASGPSQLPDDDDVRWQAVRQLRRRMQVSGFLALIGVLIPLGDLLPIFRQSPRLFVIYWLSVLGLVIWMVLLALGDLASNVAYHRLAQHQLNLERRTLKREIDQFRASGNGRHDKIAEP